MAITVWPASPPADAPNSRSADVGFEALSALPIAPIANIFRMSLGTALKVLVDGIFYIMFEVDEPEGTTFDSIQLDLTIELTLGAGTDLPFFMGLLAKDNIWDAQPETNAPGIAVYATRDLIPKAASATDAAWASGAASIVDAISFTAPQLPSHVTFGSVGSGSDFEDDQLLTDFQAAFIANESSRTASRGVPFMFFFRQNGGPQTRVYRFFTQDWTVQAERPSLTLDATFPASDPIIYEVIAKASQINVSAKSAQASVAAKADQLDVTAKADQLDVTVKTDQLDVTAKPDMIEVAREE